MKQAAASNEHFTTNIHCTRFQKMQVTAVNNIAYHRFMNSKHAADEFQKNASSLKSKQRPVYEEVNPNFLKDIFSRESLRRLARNTEP